MEICCGGRRRRRKEKKSFADKVWEERVTKKGGGNPFITDNAKTSGASVK